MVPAVDALLMVLVREYVLPRWREQLWDVIFESLVREIWTALALQGKHATLM